MTRKEKIDVLEWYCNNCERRCNECELRCKYDGETDRFTDCLGCVFSEMDNKMLNKCYNWYKELDPAACENAEAESCDVEPDVDMVNHPSHYTQGGIECIDCIKSATVGKVGIEAFCVGNAIKYLFRYEEKNGIEDVKKARWYIDRLIKELENG